MKGALEKLLSVAGTLAFRVLDFLLDCRHTSLLEQFPWSLPLMGAPDGGGEVSPPTRSVTSYPFVVVVLLKRLAKGNAADSTYITNCKQILMRVETQT